MKGVDAFRLRIGKYRGMTQIEIAKQASISQNMVSQIEKGTRDRTVKTLLAIADVLNVELDMLI